VPSIISADLKIIGNLQSSGDIQVDGQVEGDVLSRTLTVGEGATVKGSVRGETVRICGEVHGEVQASSVIIAKTARVSGDVVHQSLAIEAGAYLEGSIKRMEANRSYASATPGGAPALKPSELGNLEKTGTGGRSA
jgi:cytoskeletal protein CcmA (bactofilin family)